MSLTPDSPTAVARRSDVELQGMPIDRARFNQWSSFRTLPFVTGGHAQTIAAMFWPRGRERFPSAHHLVELPDGDKLVVVTSTPTDWRPERRTVLLVHGLCGCYGSPYMSRLAAKLYERGVRTVRMNLRGCGSGRGLARLPYHSGRSEDVRRVIEWLARDGPSPVTVIGFSLGGNIVLKLAGEDADRPTGRMDSVAAVSAPIDLLCCSQLIEQRRNWIYQTYFVRRLVADVRERQEFFPDLPPLDLPRRLTLRTFDDCYTAPRSGFRDAEDYYRRASSAPLIDRIAVETLLLTARDDPFIACEPFDGLPRRSHVRLCCTERGGHLGFLGFTGQPLAFRWMDHMLLEWLATVT